MVSVHPGQKNRNHLCLKYITCEPQLQNSYLQRHKSTDLMELGSQKTRVPVFLLMTISPAVQWGRRTRFPPSAVGRSAAHALVVRRALPCTWTGHCLVSVFLLTFSAEWIHQSWCWGFPSAFVLIAFFNYCVQAHLCITLRQAGCFLPGVMVAVDGGEPGRRTGSGKGLCGAGRAPGRTVCWKEEKLAEGVKKGKRVNRQPGGLRLRWGGERSWLGMLLYGAFRRMRRQLEWRQRKASGDTELTQFVQK